MTVTTGSSSCGNAVARWVVVIACLLCVASTAVAGEANRDRCGGVQLRILALHMTGLGPSGSWDLTVEPNGAVAVSAEGIKERFELSDGDCADMARLIEHERFFELKRGYGTPVVDGASRNLTISLGGKKHSTTLNEDAYLEADREAVKRAVRVWVAVRSLFDIPGAADSREEDRAFLEQE